MWSVGSFYSHDEIKDLKTPENIYSYVTNELTYDKTRLSSSPDRRGAQNALQEPSSSLCTDFTDTFIALAREKGIMAREIQGYGYATKQEIQPLSLKADVKIST